MNPRNLLTQLLKSRFVRFFGHSFRIIIYSFGIVLLFCLALSFTDIPYWQYHWLGTQHCDLDKEPDYIVLMGGGGMPSADGLIRSYYAAGAWMRALNSKVIIAIPPDTTNCFGSPEIQMAKELIMRGVDSNKITFERNGYSTYSQALEITEMFDRNALDTISLRLITTPEHMFRSVKVFKKAGFRHVGGSPAFEEGLDEMKLKKNQKVEKVGLNFRYNMWSYMKYEITVVREYVAIAYYKIKGWI